VGSTTRKTVGGQRAAKVLADIGRRVESGKFVKVGHLSSSDTDHESTYPETGTPIAQVAFWQEYGTRTAGARPTFGPMIEKNKAKWGPQLGVALKMTNYDAAAALAIMGESMRDSLVESIVDTPQPALSEVTLMLRKMKDDDSSLIITGATVAEARRRVAAGEKGASGTRAKPLIDTGEMQRSPDFKVEK
jgi:hypothetical protein